ncbi:MAG: hypothetical protein GF416_04400 [Candidatus Altiarchaeales archaeon]|nr:hypothetical protein [Candidatus Altiarchaeales archaeon]MBD3416361.1 hypothetical protein [Candidatus Altiarchaeales archaeon]
MAFKGLFLMGLSGGWMMYHKAYVLAFCVILCGCLQSEDSSTTLTSTSSTLPQSTTTNPSTTLKLPPSTTTTTLHSRENGSIIYPNQEIREDINKIIIMFNDEVLDNITAKVKYNASHPNEKFDKYFIYDLQLETEKEYGVKNLTRRYYSLINGGSVTISYDENLSDADKKIAGDKLLNNLDNRWYTKNAGYNVIGTYT